MRYDKISEDESRENEKVKKASERTEDATMVACDSNNSGD